MTDFRALCAELVDDLELCDWPYKLKETIRADIERARAALAEPEPKGPTDEDLDELAWNWFSKTGSTWYQIAAFRAFARAVLARWGRPTPRPVPVSERLPGPEDCDAEGRCWVWWKNGVRWVLDEWTHHELRERLLSDYVSHWLPAHALPLSTVND